MPNDVPDWTLSIQGQVAGEVEAADFKCDGLVGSQVATRWVGAVNGAAPTQIDSIGDHAWDEQGGVWVQTGGTLATWVWVPSLSAAGDLVLPSAGRGSGKATLSSDQNTAGAGILQLNNPTAAHRSLTEYQVGGASKWSAGVDTTGDYVLSDNVNALFPFRLAPNAGQLSLTGEVSAVDFRSTGVVGATAGTRYLGAVNGGPPTGVVSPVAGDYVIDFRWGVKWVWNGAVWLPSGGPGPYQARLYRSASWANSGGPNVIPYDTIDWDPNGNATTGVSASYTTPIAGRYRVTVRTGQEATGSGTIRMIVAVFVAGTEVRRTVDINGTNIIFGGGGTSVVNAAAGVAIQGVVNTVPTGAITMDSGQALTYLEVSWEGPS